MRRLASALLAAALVACAAPPVTEVNPAISGVRPSEGGPPARPEALDEALLPPMQMAMPEVSGIEVGPRFDLSVNNAPATQVFMSIVSGTHYSMLVHPNVSGTISVKLKDVTVEEALSAMRELYGYDYRLEGLRIFVQPAGLQTRVFQVNYLPGQRRGISEIRVPTPTASSSSHALESTRVTTQQQADFWTELRAALVAIVGAGQGTSVIVTPQSGVVVVRALPRQLRAVEHYLRATRQSIERQVMLEAKIVEVALSDDYQAGINWAVFNRHVPIGQLATDATVSTELGAGAVFGLGLQTSSFASLLAFLESQGNVQVLSSPRIATLNNQKAVLKVGTDEFFVTNVTTTTTSTTSGSQTSPSVTVHPFFSGIVLDVTPQIDDGSHIILHIHPAVSEVTESTRVVSLGGGMPSITLPLAKSTVNETDAIVRVTEGNIVAIGGLMSVDRASTSNRKRELVILLKPTIIHSDRKWEQDPRETRGRMERMNK